ncbi:hypothetical protein [Clostridium perfringens]|nr:hypothetical protein [Clostridium perfringens]MDH5068067.1 hypothetical protein [Clostridium perfringens]
MVGGRNKECKGGGGAEADNSIKELEENTNYFINNCFNVPIS